MIGTPNLGSPAADATKAFATVALITNPMMYPYLEAFLCFPVLNDLVEGCQATAAGINENTDYYTIAVNWISLLHFL